MSGRSKIHGIALNRRHTLCSRLLSSAVSYTDDASKVDCLRCKADEGWSRFWHATLRRNAS